MQRQPPRSLGQPKQQLLLVVIATVVFLLCLVFRQTSSSAQQQESRCATLASCLFLCRRTVRQNLRSNGFASQVGSTQAARQSSHIQGMSCENSFWLSGMQHFQEYCTPMCFPMRATVTSSKCFIYSGRPYSAQSPVFVGRQYRKCTAKSSVTQGPR